MDRTGLIGAVACFLLLVVWYEYVQTKYPYHPLHKAGVATVKNLSSQPSFSPALSPRQTGPSATEPVIPVIPEVVNILENDQIKVTLTSAGASVKQVELKKYKESGEQNIILNQDARQGILKLTGWSETGFSVKNAQPQSVTYASELPNNLHWERTYTLGKDFTLSVQDVLTNTSAKDATLPTYTLAVGRSDPLHIGPEHLSANNNAQYLGSGWLTSGFHYITVGNFDPGTFLFLFPTHPARQVISSNDFNQEPIKWIAAQNQFFASLLIAAPDRPIQQAEFHCYNERDSSGHLLAKVDPDIETFATFPEVKIPAGQTVALPVTLYAGPKEYDQLSTLGQDSSKLMNYGYFETLIVGFLYVLRTFHSLVGNWGVAIILLTLLVKTITWPLQSYTNHSAKKMQVLAPMAKELQTKYKDQPEKITAETMALYRDYGVNPLSGCLPALIQMPIFFSLYFMLQNAVELRGASFLWAHDLTLPDTILSFTFLGSHYFLNPLPLMVTGLTMGMMRLSPMASADPQQAFIAKNVMPVVFLLFLYNFASGLSLYYVVNNAVTMFQIYRNLKKPMPQLKRKPRK